MGYFTFVNKLSLGGGGVARKNILEKNYDPHAPPPNP